MKMEEKYKTEIEESNHSSEEVVKNFIKEIGAESISEDSFIFNDEKWMVCYRPFEHSDDIIVDEKEASSYDNFLLVKKGSARARIPGWTDYKNLTSTPARDIYRNGTKCYVVMDTNLRDLSIFKIKNENLILQKEFLINQQEAENLGHSEMISGLLAGMHYFAKKAGVYFKDVNQRDEFMIGNKRFKIYTRDYKSDEDMLISDSYFKEHPEIDNYVLCKIKGGFYKYLGYINKEVVEDTRVVQMTGNVDMGNTGEKIRRIFAEQYKSMSDFIKIWNEKEEEQEKIVEQHYVPLHVHSEWSVGDGFGSVSYMAETLYKKGFKSCALTDHGTLAGVWEFQKACLLKNIKPIIGCEFYLGFSERGKERFHLTVLVKNKKGWQNILKLQAIASREGFYYKPIINLDDLFKYSEGLVVLSGCGSGLIPYLLQDEKYSEAEMFASQFKENFKNDFYLEIQPTLVNNNQEVMKKIYDMSKKLDIKCVFTNDSHYPNKEDKKIHDAVKAINFKKKYGQAGYDDDCFYFMTEKDILERIKNKSPWMEDKYKEWLEVTNEIADKCNFNIEPVKEQDTLPKIEKDAKTRKEKLSKMCYEGLEKNTKYSLEDPKIKEKLDSEINRILGKGYENYFLIVADLINWAKNNGIMVGPGRGSVGASLAALCLNITDCDPIEHDLLFDRFLSEIRRDMPDVDMDFQDNRREEVFDYFRNTYGEDHCAKVATYSRFHPKGILRDIGRIFDIPVSDINKICSLVIERSGGDARASMGLQDTFAEFAEAKEFKARYPLASEIAMKLEGGIRHRSSHAAAMVVSELSIEHYAPINKIGGVICLEWEKQLVEDMHLIKFDVLGLKTLTIINEAAKAANVNLPRTFDDSKVYETIFKHADSDGIFQLGTVGMQKFSEQLNISSFSDLYDATTLFRPSCLHSGQAAVYANRKQGKEPITYFHPALESITKQSRGVILYQEQIMQIMNQVAGLSWATAEMARKVITKSKGKDAFNKMRQDFVNGAKIKSGLEKEDAEKLFDVVSTFGSYGFNKAHAVEYSIISYWSAWLKTYYPLQFYYAFLKYENEDKEIKKMISDAEKRNIKIQYPEVNISDHSYRIYNGKIYAGLNAVIGIGNRTAEKIIKNRPYKSYEDFIKKVKISSKIKKGLIAANAFRTFNDLNAKTEFLGDYFEEDFSNKEKAKMIYEYTSLIPNMQISNLYKFGNFNFINVKDLQKYSDEFIFVRGMITDSLKKDNLLRVDERHTHKFERRLLYLNLNDDTGNVALHVGPETYEKYHNILKDIKKHPVVVYGKAVSSGNKIITDMIEIVDGDLEETELRNIFYEDELLEDPNESFIVSAHPRVSKKGNSFYSIRLANGMEGLCFRFSEKLFPGMKVKFWMNQEPFINLKLI